MWLLATSIIIIHLPTVIFRQSIRVNSQKTLVSTLSPTNVDSFFLIPPSHFCPAQQWGKAARPINVSISHMFACAAVFFNSTRVDRSRSLGKAAPTVGPSPGVFN